MQTTPAAGISAPDSADDLSEYEYEYDENETEVCTKKNFLRSYF